MTVWYKQGVMGTLNPIVQKAKGRVAKMYDKKYGSDLYVTSQREGTHGAGSLHPIGDAFDCQYPPVEPHISNGVLYNIREAVGDGFDIVLHKTHIHIEYDPK